MEFLNRVESFLLGDGSLLLGLLGGLVLSLLLDVLVLVGHVLVDVLLGGEGSLSLLDLADCLLGERLLVLRPCGFDFFNIIKSDSFNGSLFSEDFVSLVLAEIRYFKFLVESSPGSGPSESLGLQLSTLKNKCTSDRNLWFSCSNTRRACRL